MGQENQTCELHKRLICVRQRLASSMIYLRAIFNKSRKERFQLKYAYVTYGAETLNISKFSMMKWQGIDTDRQSQERAIKKNRCWRCNSTYPKTQMELERPYSKDEEWEVGEGSTRVETKNGLTEQRKTTNPLDGRPQKILYKLDCCRVNEYVGFFFYFQSRWWNSINHIIFFRK